MHIIYKTVRLWGSGGIWGYYGKFKTIGQPSFTAYVTDARNCVMLTLKSGERIAISPHRKEAFLEKLSELRPDLLISQKHMRRLGD
ncbi:PH domain-containing protein [Cephaloticoccus primus]|uniref:PH domain-containing protein n=1 Tax=Cephaloticoccus primus TaxID=1548207 RepID=UPI0009EF0B2F